MSNLNLLPNVFFTSDYHAFHKKILQLGKGRPFASLEEHNSALADRHNAVVKPDDIVYNLGDYALSCQWDQAYKFRQRFVGIQHFLWGNHDRKPFGHVAEDMINAVPGCFASVKDIDILDLSKYGVRYPVTIGHFAMRTYTKSHRGAWNLYGHSHGQLPEEQRWLAFDVGVDAWDWSPVSIEQVAQKMKAKMPAYEAWRATLPAGRME
jgi:calcineurin-like phosphoesterase family protein